MILKQIPLNPNIRFPFQPMQTAQQLAPYQQVAQQEQNIGTNTSASASSGLMGLLKKLNPTGGGLTETLDHIQKLLKMAQSVTPKIQEYGPLIKNLPALLELMNEMDDEEESSPDQVDTEDESTEVLDELLGLDKENEKQETEQQKPKTNLTHSSLNQGDNLYKIETIDDGKKPIYQKPMLFI